MTSRVTPLAFDSEVLGLSCGRLEVDDGACVSDLVAGAWSSGMRHLTARIPSECSASADALRLNGFRFVLCSLSLDRVTSVDAVDDDSVSVYEREDDGRLREITCDAFSENTRFHLEPAFARERVRKLHERWIQNLIENDSVRVFVHRDGDVITGYVTVQAEETLQQAHIGLIAVHRGHHGRGIGTRLLRSAESFLMPPLRKVSVMTEKMNTRALQLYARAGYGVRKSWDVWHAYRGNDNGYGPRIGRDTREVANA